MKVTKLVIGILSIVLFLLISLQSCAAGIGNALMNNNEVSGSAGLLLAICMLVAGIIGIATCNSKGKGGSFVGGGFYIFGSILGFANAGTLYKDLIVWSILSLIFGLVFILGAIFSNKKREFEELDTIPIQKKQRALNTNAQEEVKRKFFRDCYIAISIMSVIGVVGIVVALVDGGIISIKPKENNIQNAFNTGKPAIQDSDINQETELMQVDNNEINVVPNEEVQEKADARDNSSAELTELFAGNWIVGTDIPAGRYTVTADSSGNFFIYDDNRIAIINEIFKSTESISEQVDDLMSEFGVEQDLSNIDYSGFEALDNFGVDSITVDLIEGQEIELSGVNNAIFTPAETVKSNNLTTGMWEVGLDIEAGSYVATCRDGESGNFFVYENGLAVVNEILGRNALGMGVEKIKVDLEDGQVIHISGLNSVNFR